MITLHKNGTYLIDNKEIITDEDRKKKLNTTKEEAKKNTLAYSILTSHSSSLDNNDLKIKFDALASHDITYVGIIQTARASGLKKFPVPYILTNCHNSLCAVGGTINQDDHIFGLSAAKKYSGIFVPSHIAVIHQYMREMVASCGKMILGSDSHTRYGALGTMAIGEGGGELVKQLLGQTYNIHYPEIVGVYLKGKLKIGVGAQDVALSIIKAVFKNGFVKNKIMEFIGSGVSNLNVECRNGTDVMTTETTCLSSIWTTDDHVKDYLITHGRGHDYKKLTPYGVAYYDSMIEVDLNKIEPMIAMPPHPSNVYSIRDLNQNIMDILDEVEKNAREQDLRIDLKSKVRNGKLYAEQGIIAGCAGGTYGNIIDCADILRNESIGNDVFNLSIYPASQPVFLSLVENGSIASIMSAGGIVKTAFCGPCFGAGDTPANNQFSIRHTTRNFPNREGSNPLTGQVSSVALMDAHSIAASAINGGAITAATDLNISYKNPKYTFKTEIYNNVVYNGKGNIENELIFAPNIIDWPKMPELTNDILLKVASVIDDPVTTTDELIPSGETSSYRSNPFKLSEFTLFRRDPDYVVTAKDIQKYEVMREANNLNIECSEELTNIYKKIKSINPNIDYKEVGIGSVIYANKPGDGSAREQAASCQKILGGWANIAKEYATKRYRSNLINWGLIPFIINDDIKFNKGDFIFIKDIKKSIDMCEECVKGYLIGSNTKEIKLYLPSLSKEESSILLFGCLINFYKNSNIH